MFVDGSVTQSILYQLQIVNSDCAESDDDPLTLAFLSLHVLAASQILFESNCAALNW